MIKVLLGVIGLVFLGPIWLVASLWATVRVNFELASLTTRTAWLKALKVAE